MFLTRSAKAGVGYHVRLLAPRHFRPACVLSPSLADRAHPKRKVEMSTVIVKLVSRARRLYEC